MKSMTSAALALLIAAGTASAGTTPQNVIADFRAQGYERIDLRNGTSQIRVEAIRGTERVDVVIDKATGRVLAQEVGVIRVSDNRRPGVRVRDRDGDFVRVGRSFDDDYDGPEDDDRYDDDRYEDKYDDDKDDKYDDDKDDKYDDDKDDKYDDDKDDKYDDDKDDKDDK